MSILKIGDGVKITNLNANDNLMITDDPTKEASIINIGNNGEINGLNAHRNEVHTTESFKEKMAQNRQLIIQDLENEISAIVDARVKEELQSRVEELKQIPNTLEGQWLFNLTLEKLKGFAVNVGANILASIIAKKLGF